ncbi:MAG: alkaline phosphatase family protein, partial [Methanoregula sp.]
IVPNILYALVKDFRQKTLFRKSTPSVSVNKGPKVLFWILDGCNVGAFLEAAQKNEDLKMLFEGGYFARCVTIFPSVTPAAHATLMTGCYPKKTRIPAFDWVDVTKNYAGTAEYRRYVRIMPDFKRFLQQVSSSTYQKEFFDSLGDALDLNQRFLSPFANTIFETLKETWYTESIKEWIHRGADNFYGASINSLLDDLAAQNLIQEKTMMDLLAASYKEVSYEFGDTIWGSKDFRKLADLMVYWKSGTDTVSHEYGPRSDQLKDEIDEAIGKLADTIKFYKMYTRQPLYVVITADHSHSEVTKLADMAEDFKRTFGSRYKVAGREDRADSKAINASDIILANNDRAAFFSIFGQPGAKNAIRDEIISYLKKRPETDLILCRDDTIRIIQVHEDGTSTESGNIDEFFGDKENLYPNGSERIKGLMEGKNWGDIVISVREGYSLNPDFGPVRAGEKILHGDHGGLNFSDSVVPFLIWGPTIRANKKSDTGEMYRTVDIAPTISAIFNEEQKGADGRVIRDIFT